MGKFNFKSGGSTFTGDFNIYQARNGSIVLVMGNRHTPLTEQQLNDLQIPLHQLEDFNMEDLKKFYRDDIDFNQKYLDLQQDIKNHLLRLLGKCNGGNFDFEAINQEFDDAGDNTITAIDSSCVYAEDNQGEEIDYPLGALSTTEMLHAAYVIDKHLKEAPIKA